MSYVVALDQGTTSSRALLINHETRIVDVAQKEFRQILPEEGWVEHDPDEIFSGQLSVFKEVLSKGGINGEDIAAIGITNQRETTVVWDKNTGTPVYNAIVWQCRRTADYCNNLKDSGYEDTIREKTGLVIDAYFSASKINWILENVEGARERAEKGDLLFGTIDTWLVWKLTGGRVHVTDYTNASRTMLFNIHTLKWDEELLDIFQIPQTMLPEVRSSSEVYGFTDEDITGTKIPLAGIAGDQQSSLFGQMCIEEGSFKNTYGTGCFMLMNTGTTPRNSTNGLLTTIALGFNGKITYALEGSVFMGGAVIQWLRDNLGILKNASEAGTIAAEVKDTAGVYFVSAFQGLGSPYWDQKARAGIVGLTRSASRAHIVRAAEESIAYRTKDVVAAMEQDAGIKLRELKVDGGASRDNFLLQFQSDILNIKVVRPVNVETTAMGAAYLAGLAVGFWKSIAELKSVWKEDRVFTPSMEERVSGELYEGWKNAVGRNLNWG
ncbi:MAG: glycerol kinase [Spirochaetes bacterium]|nr:MAG: glycerol kinase [Spirochaetota bacterium]